MNEEEQKQQEIEKTGTEFEGTVKSRVDPMPGIEGVPSVPGIKEEPSAETPKVLPAEEAQGVPLPTVDEKDRVVHNSGTDDAQVKDLHKQEAGEEKEVKYLTFDDLEQ